MTKTELPAVKKGDKIILLKSNNGSQRLEGHILEVTSSRTRATKSKFSAMSTENPGYGNVSIFYSGPADEFAIATNEAVIKCLKQKKEDLKLQLVEVDADIKFHTKYSSQEEFVADKLDTLINTAQNSSNKKDRVKMMTDILKELKTSNIL